MVIQHKLKNELCYSLPTVTSFADIVFNKLVEITVTTRQTALLILNTCLLGRLWYKTRFFLQFFRPVKHLQHWVVTVFNFTQNTVNFYAASGESVRFHLLPKLIHFSVYGFVTVVRIGCILRKSKDYKNTSADVDFFHHCESCVTFCDIA